MDKRVRIAGVKIRNLRKDLGWTQGEMAERAEMTQAQVSKLESGKEGSRDLVLRLAPVLGVPKETLWPEDSSIMPHQRVVRIVGKIAAGEWREAIELPYDEQGVTTAILPAPYANTPVTAMQVDGESVNKIYPNQSVVFIAPLHAIPGAPKNGQMVSVLLSRSDGTFEKTLKQFQKDENGRIWLLPQSTEPEFQAPIEYLGPKTEEVQITGVVIAAIVYPEV